MATALYPEPLLHSGPLTTDLSIDRRRAKYFHHRSFFNEDQLSTSICTEPNGDPSFGVR